MKEKDIYSSGVECCMIMINDGGSDCCIIIVIINGDNCCIIITIIIIIKGVS